MVSRKLDPIPPILQDAEVFIKMAHRLQTFASHQGALNINKIAMDEFVKQPSGLISWEGMYLAETLSRERTITINYQRVAIDYVNTGIALEKV